jgi:glucose-6-phosphate 1-epimerase
MERRNKPSALPTSPTLPQPSIALRDNILTAQLPNLPDSVTVNLYGATVTSWISSPSGTEQLFLSTAAKLDGSKPIRGGIPLVFPVFGPPPKTHATKDLPQHGFARNSYWEFLGSSSSESFGTKSDDSLKLDFGLSGGMLDDAIRKKWPYEFGLVYSVTLSKGSLEVGMHLQNKGDTGFEFQTLFHTYFRVKVRCLPTTPCHLMVLTNDQDISTTTITGLASAPYIDKVRSGQKFTESADPLKLTSETDRVYTTPTPSSGILPPLSILENGKPKITITRDGLPDVTVWNQWEEKAKGMADFEPKDGWKGYICVEPGNVSGWTKLEAGDAWEGSCVLECKL